MFSVARLHGGLLTVGLVGAITILISLYLWIGNVRDDLRAVDVLDGVKHHDFGTVPLRGQTIELLHIFSLRNDRAQKVIIKSAKASCACMVARPTERAIEPGQTIEVPVTLRMSAAGRRDAQVRLSYSDGRADTLTVTGVARESHVFFAAQRAVQLRSEESESLPLVAKVMGGATPPHPVFRVPEGVDVALEGWRRVYPHSSANVVLVDGMESPRLRSRRTRRGFQQGRT